MRVEFVRGWAATASLAAMIAALSASGAWAQDTAADAPLANPGQAAVPPRPSTTEDRIRDLEARIADLQDAISDLKVQSSAAVRDVRAQAAAQPTVSVANGRPTFTSADGRFSAAIRGVLQFDAATAFQDTPGPITTDLRRGAGSGDTARARDLNSGVNFRRARIGVEGKVFGDFDYNLLVDFGGGSGAEDAGRIQEFWLQYSGAKPWKLKVGAFAPLLGLEDANSTNAMPFLERPAPADVGRGIAGADTRTAVQISANGDHWLVAGALTGPLISSINSTGSATAQAFDEQLGLTGRATLVPFHGQDWQVHVGVNGSYVLRPADNAGPEAGAATAQVGRYVTQLRERPELRVDGTRLVDTGAIDSQHAYHVGLEFAAQKKNFYFQTEWFRYGIERRISALSNPKFSGWYAEGSWILTGEARRYNPANAAFDAPSITNPFSLKDGKWGAWEVALRYSDLDLNYHAGAAGTATPVDGVRGGEQNIWSFGLNWYVNSVVRFMLDVQDVKVDRLSPNATTYLTPVGAQIGQHYQAVSLRSQLAF